jgi:CRISPR/Cas system endoribonuclease Cas6 (RAMP superfamily)
MGTNSSAFQIYFQQQNTLKKILQILKQPWNYTRQIKIGDMKFRIDSLDKLVVNVTDNLPISLITGTPIIVRIPREKYKDYDIEPSGK